MRIALVIDSLNSGGAQRQMAMLALLLKRASHDVSLFRYRTRDFFDPCSKEQEFRSSIRPRAGFRGSGICGGKFVVFGLTSRSRFADPQSLIGIGGLPSRESQLSFRSRSNRFANPTLRERLSVNLHRVADAMVANSYEASKGIRNAVPSLNGKVHVITNCVDLEKFVPSEVAKTDSRKVVFSVLARFHDNKNAIGLAQAVRIVMDQHSPDADFVVNWYGNNFYQDGSTNASLEELR